MPKLFHVALDKEASVADHMQLQNDSVHWVLNFFYEGYKELEFIFSILDLVYSVAMRGHGIINYAVSHRL